MALPVRKGYTGNGVTTTLTSSPSNADTTFTVAAVTGWPATYPFYIVVDPGTSKEEKMKVTGVSSLTVTVTRGQDDTTAVSHASGATVYPVFTADEADEANKIASAMTTKGDIITTDGSDINRLGVGTNTHVLQADSAATNGIKWGQVATAGIADGAVTADKLGTGAVTSAKILDGTIVLGDLAAALQAFLVPVGTITAYAGATAPTGWLMCDGTSTTGYTTLAGLVGATTPDLRGRFPMGKTASSTGSTLLGTGGSNTITSSNMPAHTHSIDHNHASANTVEMDDTFLSHSITDPGHFHDTFSSLYLFDYQSGNDDSANSFQTANNDQNTSTNTTGISIGNHNIKHSHSLDLPNFTGTSGETGSGTAYFQPFVAVNYIIKHD